jgi:anti-sigma regulatory factor (Ser/Thr protein kinase)
MGCDALSMNDAEGETTAPPLDADAHMPHRVDSVPAARAFLTQLLHGWDIADQVIDDASLLTTELMSNAVEHGSGIVDLEIAVQDGLLHIGVHDGSVELPVKGDRTVASREGGRGIWLVQSIARDWGSDSSGEEPGKTVWFELTTLHTPSRS